MNIYTLKQILAATGNKSFFKLVESKTIVDDEDKVVVVKVICYYDKFINGLHTNYKFKILKIRTLMDQFSRGIPLPKEKCKLLEGAYNNVQEFEFKADDLRVYFFIDDFNIVVNGGLKDNQNKDIKHFRNRSADYLNSKQENQNE